MKMMIALLEYFKFGMTGFWWSSASTFTIVPGNFTAAIMKNISAARRDQDCTNRTFCNGSFSKRVHNSHDGILVWTRCWRGTSVDLSRTTLRECGFNNWRKMVLRWCSFVKQRWAHYTATCAIMLLHTCSLFLIRTHLSIAWSHHGFDSGPPDCCAGQPPAVWSMTGFQARTSADRWYHEQFASSCSGMLQCPRSLQSAGITILCSAHSGSRAYDPENHICSSNRYDLQPLQERSRTKVAAWKSGSSFSWTAFFVLLLRSCCFVIVAATSLCNTIPIHWKSWFSSTTSR